MLKDLLSHRLFVWSFVCLVLIVVGCVLYLKHVEQQAAEELARTEARIKQLTQTGKPTADAGGDTEQDRHWHADGTWHDRAHTVQGRSEFENENQPFADAVPETADEIPWDDLTPEQQAQVRADYWRHKGLEPPPLGYTYLMFEDGRAVLHKEAEPYVRVGIRIGFAPTKAQYEEYLRLQEALNLQQIAGNLTEVARIQAEIEALEASAQGELPTFYTNFSGKEGESFESVMKRVELAVGLQAEIEYRKRGLAHLLPRNRER